MKSTIGESRQSHINSPTTITSYKMKLNNTPRLDDARSRSIIVGS